MYNILVVSFKRKIGIKTESALVCKSLFESSLPYMTIADYSVRKWNGEVCDIEICQKNTNTPKLKTNKKGTRYILWDDWEKECPNYFFTFLGCLFEKLLRQDGKFLIHSSAVQSTNNNFIFIGQAGAGKTSLMLELVLKRGFKFIANNKTIISQLKNGNSRIDGGTKGISIRPHMFDAYNWKKITNNSVELKYGRKIFLINKKMIAAKRNIKPVIIVFLALNSGEKIFKRLTNDEAFIKLYPALLNLTDREVVLFNWTLPAPIDYGGHIEKTLAQKAVHQIISQGNTFLMIGSLDYMSKCIANFK